MMVKWARLPLIMLTRLRDGSHFFDLFGGIFSIADFSSANVNYF